MIRHITTILTGINCLVDNTETHFGGFLRKKRPLEGNGEDNGPKEKTRKQAIDEIVAKSKLHKVRNDYNVNNKLLRLLIIN